jgi:hypothetical protein
MVARVTSRHIRRRILGMGIALTLSAYLVFRYEWAWRANPHAVYLTGWGLLGLMLYLTLFNARKKLPFLPLVSARAWLQVHAYAGLVTAVVFLMHIQWRIPDGQMESLLALLFVAVTVSGILGWWISRAIPSRMTAVGGEVPFEEIPVARLALKKKAEALIVQIIPTAKASTLAEFYAGRLAEFFSGPANFQAHLFGSRRPLNRLLGQMAEVNRFLGPEEKKGLEQLTMLVRQKDALDFHRASQIVLKGWLFVHIPLTYGLLVFSAAHIIVVYAFSGGHR